MALFGVFLIAAGLFHVIAPYAAWYMSIGWKLCDAEPSDTYLAMSRIGGTIGIVLGVIVLIIAVSH